ncbi:CRISPR-associated endonuclease Cas1 [bacterium]|nr:CRISPR-associated endonuclease Cas1 [candidate division CSSED10-310 bacterium]
MLNEYIYCPRLAYLEWVQGEFADSADTIRGRFTHRRVDQPTLAERLGPVGNPKTHVVDAAYLSATVAGLVAKLDRVEISGLKAVPVDFKKGSKPSRDIGVWDADRVQLCAQGIILEENGYTVDHGIAYYAASRKRVPVEFDAELRKMTIDAAHGIRRMAESRTIPPPLEDSPKCPGCSLVGICLPDETDYLHHDDGEPVPEPAPRKILPSADESLPLYIQTQGLSVGKSHGVLTVKQHGKVIKEIPIHEISSISLFGGVQISTQAMQTLCYRNVPICFFSHGGWFYGVTRGLGHKNIELRIAQYHGVDNQDISLRLARAWVADKIRNSRTLLRRNSADFPPDLAQAMNTEAKRAETADSKEVLLGIEGTAARIYFSNFHRMLKARDRDGQFVFGFEHRNRRPPRDPVNALLSFAYSLLTKTWMVTVQSVGFDPYLGFYHALRYGRPALALDMMEPFRSLVADSAVLFAINNGVVRANDFVTRINAVSLKENARSRFIATFEKRLTQTITHPVFGYKISYRQLFEVQARLLGRYLFNEIDAVPRFVTR